MCLQQPQMKIVNIICKNDVFTYDYIMYSRMTTYVSIYDYINVFTYDYRNILKETLKKLIIYFKKKYGIWACLYLIGGRG